jgi:hypothetical protein
MVHALKGELRPGDLRALLAEAARSDPAAAHGVRSVAAEIAALVERLPRSLLRCAFAAAIRTRRRWDAPEAEAAKQAERYRWQCAAAVRRRQRGGDEEGESKYAHRTDCPPGSRSWRAASCEWGGYGAVRRSQGITSPAPSIGTKLP